MWKLVIIFAVMGALAWALTSIPDNLPSDDASRAAVTNVAAWLETRLGPHWALTLGAFAILISIIVWMSDGVEIEISDEFAAPLKKTFALLTMAVAALMTYQLRNTGSTIEFIIVALLLGVNGYLLWSG